MILLVKGIAPAMKELITVTIADIVTITMTIPVKVK